MGIIKTKNAFVTGAASVVGSSEYKGPLGDLFDVSGEGDDTFGMDTWEKSESEMQRIALELAAKKRGIVPGDLDAVIAGDLIDQCLASTGGLIGFGIPYFGIFGACSTCAEGLLAAAVAASYLHLRCGVVTSSHNCTAERQFRFPVEYGCVRTPTSQWTVTGAGAFTVEDSPVGAMAEICDVMLGRAVDYGITDANNMGAAMAPAAADTVERYLKESGRAPNDIGLIVTGDLGYEGGSILKELLLERGYDISSCYRDCGMMIFDTEEQDMHAGGSGCGCSATVMASYFLPKLMTGEVSEILFIGTGALMNSMSLAQGTSIPGIAHAVRFKCPQGGK